MTTTQKQACIRRALLLAATLTGMEDAAIDQLHRRLRAGTAETPNPSNQEDAERWDGLS